MKRWMMALCLALGWTAVAPSQGELADYERAKDVLNQKPWNLVERYKIDSQWYQGGARFWYRVRTDNHHHEHWDVESATGAKRPLFQPGFLAAMEAATSRTFDRATSVTFVSMEFTPGELKIDETGTTVTFQAFDQEWTCRLDGGGLREVGAALEDDDSRRSERDRRRGRGDYNRAISPDGRFIADQDRRRRMTITEVESGKQWEITDRPPARAEYVWPAWSEDSSALVFHLRRWGDKDRMARIEIPSEDSLYPRMRTQDYDLPGEKLDTLEPMFWKPGFGNARPVQIPVIEYPKQLWHDFDTANNALYWIVYERGYQKRMYWRAEMTSGTATLLRTETSDTFLAPEKMIFAQTGDGRNLIIASERDGWNHLYLLDAQTGALGTQLTSGTWVVREIKKVDAASSSVVFLANGREPGNPYDLHAYRLDIPTRAITRLTSGPGHHEFDFSPDFRFLIDRRSAPNIAPEITLRDATTGELIRVLERADISRLVDSGWKAPIPFVAKGRDGQTDIYGVLRLPSSFDPSKKYPVIESIYPGPHGSHVYPQFHPATYADAVAEVGFIVVEIDGMGTARRGKKFHDVAYKNLKDAGLPDRVAWIKTAAQRYPWIDVDRVGIYGDSAGGYASFRAVLDYPDFYKAASPGCGNHDHRTDKTWWNELWMGYPIGDHYREQSNVTDAHKLTRPVLLIHGAQDTNVNLYAGTLFLVDALIEANKDFELLILPRDGHFVGWNHYTHRRRWDFFVRELWGKQPPKEFNLGKRKR